jgi:hypothetical protein
MHSCNALQVVIMYRCGRGSRDLEDVAVVWLCLVVSLDRLF